MEIEEREMTKEKKIQRELGQRLSGEWISGGEENKGNYGILRDKCYTVLPLC